MSKEWDILHTSTMPVIALRGLTVFPNVLIHFEIARDASVRALEAAMTAGDEKQFRAAVGVEAGVPILAVLGPGDVEQMRSAGGCPLPGQGILLIAHGTASLLRNFPKILWVPLWKPS